MAKLRRSVVTGGAGFVGRHLCDGLRARGDEVISVDVGARPWRDDVHCVDADIRDERAMAERFAGADVVFHNASLVHTKRNRVADVWSVNLEGSRSVLGACRQAGVTRLVYVSSASAVYQGEDIENGDERLPYSRGGQAPYAESKVAAERELLAASSDALKVVAIRPHVVFGPGDTRFLPAILERARAGRLKRRVGRDKLSDFTYVTNLVDALLAADDKLDTVAAGQAYFVTNGEPTAFFDFVSLVLVELGLPPPRGSIPYPLVYGVAAIAEAWDTLKGGTLHAEGTLSRFAVRYLCTHHYFSIAKARRDLGYEPRVSIREGVRLTTAHLRATGAA